MRREEEARSLAAAQQQQAARSKMTAASGVRSSSYTVWLVCAWAVGWPVSGRDDGNKGVLTACCHEIGLLL